MGLLSQASLPTGAHSPRQKRRGKQAGVGVEILWRAGPQYPPPPGRHHQLGTATCSVQFNPTTAAIFTLSNEVTRLKHTLSLFPGYDNSHKFLFNVNHLTVPGKWFSLLCVPATTSCERSQRVTRKPRGSILKSAEKPKQIWKAANPTRRFQRVFCITSLLLMTSKDESRGNW